MHELRAGGMAARLGLGGADRRAKRTAIARNGGSALTVATLCPCGAPACPDAAAARVRERCLERHPFLKTVLGSPQQLDIVREPLRSHVVGDP